ncbi:MAG: DEAD/DEAH box helicase [Candidatus Omnitrophica bacterium]|nr:DEAD/DEAH box helicase [Candidatus Omnitrophota bacterium]
MTPNSQVTFDGLGIAPRTLEILDRLKFKTPTPIQQKAILPAIEGKDLVGIAQTGTGKTLAFVIPMVQRLSQSKGKGLVLVPTRELAHQVDETFQKIGPPFGIRSTVVIGGASMNEQVRALHKHPGIIIATPGRLLDHLNQRTVTLSDVRILILDEADRMFDMGFLPQIDRILKVLPKDRQTMLFSATMPQAIAAIATSHMKLPINVEIAPSGTLVEKLTQELFIVKKENKNDLLRKLLDQYHGSVLVFTRTKVGARRTARDIKSMGHRAADIHSDRSLAQRREALQGFKAGRYRVLVATDIAARGIDVMGIELVINYNLPEDAENYVHRIGRTGRAGHQGHAISFATPDQKNDVASIERLIRTALPISEHPEIPIEHFYAPMRRTFAPRGFRSARSHSSRRRFGARR